MNDMRDRSEDTTSEEKEIEHQGILNRRNIIFTLALIAVVIVWGLVSGNGSGDPFDWGDTGVTVTCPDDTEFTMNYSDVVSLELVTVSDYGTCISGEETNRLRYGVWENDTWGQYELYATKSFDECIVMQSADSVLVINFEAAETTASFLDIIQEYCDAS